MRAYTAAELASLSLPDMPADVSAMVKRAKREQWSGQKRSARGGGTEYPAPVLMKVLPEPAKEVLLRLITEDDTPKLPAVINAPATPVPSNQNAPATLADWQRACANARAAVLTDLETLAGLIGTERAVKKMIMLADTGELRPELLALVPVANARAGTDGSRHLSRPTLYRWRADYAREGWIGLVPQESAKRQLVPAWANELLKLYRVPSKRSLSAVVEDLAKKLPAEVTPPSYDQARRFLASMSIVDRERGRHGPNGLLKFKGFKRRSTDGLQPLDVVTADGHTHKDDVAHPMHGKPFRPEVCAILDVATRYVFGWSIGLAESSHVVMDAIRHGISQLGLFGIFYTDNGSGYIAEAMTDEVLGMLGRIGATPKNSIPGRAQARGKIERLQASLWKRSARKEITYAGRDMDNEARRKVIKIVSADIKRTGASPLLKSWHEFIDWCRSEVNDYNDRPHRSLPKIRDAETGKLRPMTPRECLQDHIAKGWQPEAVPQSSMDDLFRPVERRVVQRGEVSLPWGRYFHRDLVAFGKDTVRVGYDIHDASRVWVSTDTDGRLICIAEKDANVIPEQPASAVEHARLRRAAAKLKLAERDRQLALAELGINHIDLQPDRPMPPELAATMAVLQADFEKNGTIMSTPNDARYDEADDSKRFRRAIGIRKDIEAGRQVSGEELAWYQAYQHSAEFKGNFALYETYGDDMFS